MNRSRERETTVLATFSARRVRTEVKATVLRAEASAALLALGCVATAAVGFQPRRAPNAALADAAAPYALSIEDSDYVHHEPPDLSHLSHLPVVSE